jgi:NO-binding membrane sensor protein with MHYT domain
MPMPVVHQFAYGPVNPVLSFVMAFVGSQLGLSCTARARRSRSVGRRARWLVLASFAIGGAGIWLMHYMAMLGFDVPASPVRYGVELTALSLLASIGVVGVGLFIVGYGRPKIFKILLGGLLMGGGVAAMHYIGMAAINIDGTITYDRNLVVASVIIAVVASISALWFTVAIEGWVAVTVASFIFAFAVCAMHYTAMAAVRVHLSSDADTVSGISPVVLVVPIVVIAIAALLGLVLGALTMMGDEEFRLIVNRDAMDGTPSRLGGAAQRRAATIRSRPGADDEATVKISPTFLPANGGPVQSAALRSHRSRG